MILRNFGLALASIAFFYFAVPPVFQAVAAVFGEF